MEASGASKEAERENLSPVVAQRAQLCPRRPHLFTIEKEVIRKDGAREWTIKAQPLLATGAVDPEGEAETFRHEVPFGRITGGTTQGLQDRVDNAIQPAIDFFFNRKQPVEGHQKVYGG